MKWIAGRKWTRISSSSSSSSCIWCRMKVWLSLLQVAPCCKLNAESTSWMVIRPLIAEKMLKMPFSLSWRVFMALFRSPIHSLGITSFIDIVGLKMCVGSEDVVRALPSASDEIKVRTPQPPFRGKHSFHFISWLYIWLTIDRALLFSQWQSYLLHQHQLK